LADRDGTVLVLTTWGSDGDGGGDLWAKPLEGDPRALIESPFEEYQPQLSPDGRWLAYVSTESGNEKVYVQPYPSLNRRWLVSRGGGREPRWSPLGGELFYRRGRGVFVVGFTALPEFLASAPELLFEGDYHKSAASNEPDYDIGADGRFLMIRKEEPYRKIHVVLNWFSELERLVPIPWRR
jgi:serine/threonine-protein kinase